MFAHVCICLHMFFFPFMGVHVCCILSVTAFYPWLHFILDCQGHNASAWSDYLFLFVIVVGPAFTVSLLNFKKNFFWLKSEKRITGSVSLRLLTAAASNLLGKLWCVLTVYTHNQHQREGGLICVWVKTGWVISFHLWYVGDSFHLWYVVLWVLGLFPLLPQPLCVGPFLCLSAL